YEPYLWTADPASGETAVEILGNSVGFDCETWHEYYEMPAHDMEFFCVACLADWFTLNNTLAAFDDGSVISRTDHKESYITICEVWYHYPSGETYCQCREGDPYNPYNTYPCEDYSSKMNGSSAYTGNTIISSDYFGKNSTEYIFRNPINETTIFIEAPGSPCEEYLQRVNPSSLVHLPDGDFMLAYYSPPFIWGKTTDIDRSGWSNPEQIVQPNRCDNLDACGNENGDFWIIYRDGDTVFLTTNSGNLPPENTRGVDLLLNSELFQAGDPFKLRAVCQDPGFSYPADLYVILDVYGDFFFFPTWSKTPDSYRVNLDSSKPVAVFVLDFSWPAGISGSANGLVFWGGMQDPETGEIIGQIDAEVFGYI
ncbi:hypothetical protein JW979_12045, partial [bacterium]|nr:hypothetical protein [candidate division CSSED10-310 bacterium]